MKIKICGLKRISDIIAINEAQVDFAGFIFAKKSKRCITIDIVRELKRELTPEIKSVGVFVNNDINEIKKIYDEGIIDFIQLHGEEDEAYIKELKKFASGKIIKAYPADERLKEAIEKTNADYVLIDSKSEGQFGGTGKTFDIGLIPVTDKKIFLAGGITVENATKILDKFMPYCLDINSGVETNGYKDEKKIKEIVKAIRQHLKDKGNNNE